jgi:hypothetical protein
MAYTNPKIPTVNIEEQDPVTGLISEGTVVGTPPAGATYAGIFSLECELTDTEGSGTYTNTGSVAVPAWTLFGTVTGLANGKIFVGSAGNVAAAQTMKGDATIVADGTLTIANDAVTTVKILDEAVTTEKIATDGVETLNIKDANVTLDKLAAGVAPSHVAKFGGKITWSGSGASLATTVTGVAATDIVIATVQVKATETSYLVSAAPTTDTITLVLSAANTSNDAVIAYTVFTAAA